MYTMNGQIHSKFNVNDIIEHGTPGNKLQYIVTYVNESKNQYILYKYPPIDGLITRYDEIATKIGTAPVTMGGKHMKRKKITNKKRTKRMKFMY